MIARSGVWAPCMWAHMLGVVLAMVGSLGVVVVSTDPGDVLDSCLDHIQLGTLSGFPHL